MAHVFVGDKALQPADTHRFALACTHAHFFALILLRTYPPANGGQRAGLSDYVISTLKIALRRLRDKGGNINIDRAA